MKELTGFDLFDVDDSAPTAAGRPAPFDGVQRGDVFSLGGSRWIVISPIDSFMVAVVKAGTKGKKYYVWWEQGDVVQLRVGLGDLSSTLQKSNPVIQSVSVSGKVEVIDHWDLSMPYEQYKPGMRRNFKEKLPGGKASGMSPSDFDPEQLAHGTVHELEHTSDVDIAIEIAMDHLAEDPMYYEKLQEVEMRRNGPEATAVVRVGRIMIRYLGPYLRELAPELRVIARKLVVMVIEGVSVTKIADYLEKKGVRRSTAEKIATESKKVSLDYAKKQHQSAHAELRSNGAALAASKVANRAIEAVVDRGIRSQGRLLKHIGERSLDGARGGMNLLTGGLSEDAIEAMARRKQGESAMKRNSKSESREDLIEAVNGERVRIFERDEDDAYITYNHWYSDKNGDWVVPDMLEGSDYTGGVHVRANQKVFLEGWPDHDEWLKIATGGHGTKAFVINWKKCPLDALQAIAGLSDYALLSDEATSELESEEESEALDRWALADFTRALEKHLDIGDLEHLSAGDAYELFRLGMERGNVNWNHTSEGPWIDVKEVAEEIVQEDLPLVVFGEFTAASEFNMTILRVSKDGKYVQVTGHDGNKVLGPVWVRRDALYDKESMTWDEWATDNNASVTPPHGAAEEQRKLFTNRRR